MFSLHLDLNSVPFVLYGVNYIDLVSLAPLPGHIDHKQIELQQAEQRQACPSHI